MSLLDQKIQDYRLIWKSGVFLRNNSNVDVESEDGNLKDHH